MKSSLHQPENTRSSGFIFSSSSLFVMVFLLASCNLLFLDLGYEDKDPEFEQFSVYSNYYEIDPLLPTFEAMIQDDTGIDSLSCSVVTGDGETKSFLFKRTNERERYIWSVSRSLGDLVSAGDNTLTFKATDLAGNTVEKKESLYFSSDIFGLKWDLDRSQTPWVMTFWHPAGITNVTYVYEASTPPDSEEYILTNIDVGTGDGGDKLFKGTMVIVDPFAYSRVRFQITTPISTIEKAFDL